MASERLQVILELETGNYKREARQASDSTKEIGTAADQTGGKLQKLEGRFKGVGIAAAGALGAAALAFAGDALKSASDLGESINAVEKAFESGAETVLAFGEQAATSAGLAQSEFNQLVVPIGALLRNFGLSAQEAGDQAVALTQRAADLASVFNTDVSEALTAVQAALRGEGDPIERFGANVSAARVEAYALAEGLVETKSEIDDNVKVMARLGLIFQDTERFAGDFSDTADELANKTRTLAAEWENLKATVGEDLIEPASSAATFAGRVANLIGVAFAAIPNTFDSVNRSIALADLAVSRLRRETGGFAGQEGAAFLHLLEDLPDQVIDNADVIEAYADALNLTADDLSDLLDLLDDPSAWSESGDAVEALSNALGITEDQAANLLPILEALNDELAREQGIDAYGQRMSALAGFYGETASGARDAAGANRELAGSFLEVLEARRELISPLFAAAKSQERKSEAREALGEVDPSDTEAVARAQLDLLEATLEADVATEEYARTFRASFEDAQGVADEFNIDLLEILENLGILRDLAPIDIRFTTNAPAVLGAIDTSVSNDPRLIDDSSARPQPRASGGPVVTDKPYLVGEFGPELFIPKGDGQIVAHDKIIIETAQRPMSAGEPFVGERSTTSSETSTEKIVTSSNASSSEKIIIQPEGRMHGGPMNAGEPYFVGERGVELVVPNVPSFVIPNHQLTQSDSTSTTVVNLGGISITGVDTADPLRLARSIRREMDRELASYRGGVV